jgi:hypothetical protein
MDQAGAALKTAFLTSLFLAGGAGGSALADGADPAEQFSNPFASLISVPFQFNYDSGVGPNDGERASWETEEWSGPVNVAVAKLTQIGEQPVSCTAGVRHRAASPEDGPDGVDSWRDHATVSRVGGRRTFIRPFGEETRKVSA